MIFKKETVNFKPFKSFKSFLFLSITKWRQRTSLLVHLPQDCADQGRALGEDIVLSFWAINYTLRAGNNSRSSDIVRPNFENVRPISHFDRT